MVSAGHFNAEALLEKLVRLSFRRTEVLGDPRFQRVSGSQTKGPPKPFADMIVGTSCTGFEAVLALADLVRSAGAGNKGAGTGFRRAPDFDWEPHALPSRVALQLYVGRALVALRLELGVREAVALAASTGPYSSYVVAADSDGGLVMQVDDYIHVPPVHGLNERSILMDAIARSGVDATTVADIWACVDGAETRVDRPKAWVTEKATVKAALVALKRVAGALYGLDRKKNEMLRKNTTYMLAKALVVAERTRVMHLLAVQAEESVVDDADEAADVATAAAAEPSDTHMDEEGETDEEADEEAEMDEEGDG